MKKKLCYLLLLICYQLNSLNVAAQKKLNVIFIGVDDLSIAFDAYRNPQAPAPNFARLMQHGMLFRKTYCQYPVCSPSRTSILSGQRPDKTGITSNSQSLREVLGNKFRFLPEYFHDYNYRTERFGKATCAHENEITWDHVVESAKKTVHVKNGVPAWWIDTMHEDESETGNGVVTDAVIKKIQNPVSQPYFYSLGLTTHNPFTPILTSWNKTGDSATKELLPVDAKGTITNVRGNGSDNIILPNTPANDTADIPKIALKDLLQYPSDEQKRIRHAYYGEIIEMDVSLGVLLDELDRLNLWNSSILVFYSDHGLQMGEHQGMWMKNTLFEESLRVPFIICAPGKKTGICNKLVELVDIYSTLTELCGLPAPPDQEGLSLVPLLENPEIEWKKAIFSQDARPIGGGFEIMGRSVRTDSFHYNSWAQFGEELYNIKTDSHEYTNLAQKTKYNDILIEMRDFLEKGWVSALPNGYPQVMSESKVPFPSSASSSYSVEFSLYPIPSRGNLKITYNSKNAGIVQLKAIDIWGRVLFSKTEQATTGINNYEINLSYLKPGLYYLELNAGPSSNRKKFMIEK